MCTGGEGFLCLVLEPCKCWTVMVLTKYKLDARFEVFMAMKIQDVVF